MNSSHSNQLERQSWKNLIELEKLTHFRILKAVPDETVHFQDMDAALNALKADIGPALDRVCCDLHRIKAQ